MKICRKALTMQIDYYTGNVRGCCNYPHETIGNILESNISEIRHSEQFSDYITPMLHGDYSKCASSNSCYYFHNGTLQENMIEVDEIPEYPRHLMLCFENICNYQCTCCFAHSKIADLKSWPEARDNCDRIAEKLEGILPHIRSIYANGAGELFASPRTLRLLANWKPLAPPEECKVSIDTNGSLFTPDNWKKIENIGQYYVKVNVSVMSFREPIFQHLSGTKLPISTIENNLKYIRALREQGIINQFQIGTVLQEENFREIPQFIHRSLEEFHADGVRINQFFSGGVYNKHIQWFMNVRNPEHPYYEQYQQVMSDPIVHDPRVIIQGGIRPSVRREHPGVKSDAIQRALKVLLDNPDALLEELRGRKTAIYGLGTLGRLIISQYKEKTQLCCAYSYSTHKEFDEYQGVPVVCLSDERTEVSPDIVVVTAYDDREEIAKLIRSKLGSKVRIVDIWDELETYRAK